MGRCAGQRPGADAAAGNLRRPSQRQRCGTWAPIHAPSSLCPTLISLISKVERLKEEREGVNSCQPVLLWMS